MKSTPGEAPTIAQRQADALILLAKTALRQGLDPGPPGERHQVVVHVDAPVLADPDQPGQSVLEDGVHVPAGTGGRFPRCHYRWRCRPIRWKGSGRGTGRRGFSLHARNLTPSWLGERLDLGWALDVLHPLANPAAARGASAGVRRN